MGYVGLPLAEEKAELILISKSRKNTCMKIKVGDYIIDFQLALKYIGLVFDHNLNFEHHLQYAATKASNVSSLIARMLPYIGANTKPSITHFKSGYFGVIVRSICVGNATR